MTPFLVRVPPEVPRRRRPPRLPRCGGVPVEGGFLLDPVQVAGGVADAEVPGREHVRPAEAEHQQHPRAPHPQPPHGDDPRGDFRVVQRRQLRDDEFPRPHGGGDVADVLRLPPAHPARLHLLQRQPVDRLRREPPPRSGGFEPAGDGLRRGHADLLGNHDPDQQREQIPLRRQPQRPDPVDDGAKDRVAVAEDGDGLRGGLGVEQAGRHAANHSPKRQRGTGREAPVRRRSPVARRRTGGLRRVPR